MDTSGSIKCGRTFFITGTEVLAMLNYHQYLKGKKVLKVEVSKISNGKRLHLSWVETAGQEK